jgi:hypothetical protein
MATNTVDVIQLEHSHRPHHRYRSLCGGLGFCSKGRKSDVRIHCYALALTSSSGVAVAVAARDMKG